MTAGRPPGHPLDSATPGLVAQGVMDLVSRGRGQIPTTLATSLTWIQGPKRGTDTLVVLSEAGIAKLLPWEPDGPRVLARRKELIQAAAKDPAVHEALVALENRYKKSVIGTDYRITLPAELTAHLEISDEPPARAFIVCMDDHLELMSLAAHNRLLSRSHPALEDLP